MLAFALKSLGSARTTTVVVASSEKQPPTVTLTL